MSGSAGAGTPRGVLRPLTATQLAIFAQVCAGGEPTTVTALARRLALGKGSVSRIVARLAERAYVAREPDRSDPRQQWIRPTPKGIAAYGGWQLARRTG